MRHSIQFEYKIKDSTMIRSNSVIDLGVSFDQTLTFHQHVTTVAKESFQRLGLLFFYEIRELFEILV